MSDAVKRPEWPIRDWEGYRMNGQRSYRDQGRQRLPEELVPIILAVFAQENLPLFLDWLQSHGKDAYDFEFGGVASWLSQQNVQHLMYHGLLQPGVLPAPVESTWKCYPIVPIELRPKITGAEK